MTCHYFFRKRLKYYLRWPLTLRRFYKNELQKNECIYSVGERVLCHLYHQSNGISSAEVGVEDTMHLGLIVTPHQYLFYSLSRAAGASTCVFSPNWLSSKGRRVRRLWMVNDHRRPLPWVKAGVSSPEMLFLRSNFELFPSAVGPYYQCHANLKQPIILWVT